VGSLQFVLVCNQLHSQALNQATNPQMRQVCSLVGYLLRSRREHHHVPLPFNLHVNQAGCHRYNRQINHLRFRVVIPLIPQACSQLVIRQFNRVILQASNLSQRQPSNPLLSLPVSQRVSQASVRLNNQAHCLRCSQHVVLRLCLRANLPSNRHCNRLSSLLRNQLCNLAYNPHQLLANIHLSNQACNQPAFRPCNLAMGLPHSLRRTRAFSHLAILQFSQLSNLAINLLGYLQHHPVFSRRYFRQPNLLCNLQSSQRDNRHRDQLANRNRSILYSLRMYLPAFHRQFQAINRQLIHLASLRQVLARYQQSHQVANHLLFQQFSRRYNRVVGHRGSLHFNQATSLQKLLQYSQLEGQPELQASSLPVSLLAFRLINPRYSHRLCQVAIRPLSQAISLPLTQAHSLLVTRQPSHQETRVVNRLLSRLINHHCNPFPFRPIVPQ